MATMCWRNQLATAILLFITAVSSNADYPRLEALTALAKVFSDPSVNLPWRPPTTSARPLLPDVKISESCAQDLVHYWENLNGLKPWALKMFDSSTKIPEGILYGNLVHMGNFDECLSVRNIQRMGEAPFDGQHCMVTLTAAVMLYSGSKGTKESDDMHQELAHWEETLRAVQTGNVLLATRADLIKSVKVPLQVAWCAPSSCSPKEINDLVAAAMINVNASYDIGFDTVNVNLAATVNPSQCHTPEKPSLKAIDIFAICLLSVFVALAAASTAYDVITQEKKNRRPVLLAFSVYSNWPRLIAVNTGGDQLHCLHGIRVISIGWVVLGHVYLVNAALPATNSLVYMKDFIPALSRLVIMNATVSVDTFFFMSGLLLSFLFLKEVRKTNRFAALKFYIHRYIRLTPALAIMLLLTVSIINYAGNGPLWHSRHNIIKKVCEDNWWTNIIYVNNYVHPNEMCLGHTWYLAVDMQLHWLSPLVLIPMWKLKKRITMCLITFLLLAGWAIPFTIVYLRELYPGTYVGSAEKRSETMQYYYWPTHTRFAPWLLGILLGYILQDSRTKKPELSEWVITIGWIIATVFMTGALNGAYPFQQTDYKYNRVEAAFWLSLFRPMWTIGLAWIVFACDQGYGGIVNTILSWGFWQPLARLSYGVYLVHISILNLFAGVVQTPIYLADVNAIPQFFGVLMMSIAWAIPLALLFESPIILIDKALFAKKTAPKPDYYISTSYPKDTMCNTGPAKKRWDETVIDNGKMTLPRIAIMEPRE